MLYRGVVLEILNNKQIFCEEGAVKKLSEILKVNKLSRPFLVVFNDLHPICAGVRIDLESMGIEVFTYKVRTEPDLHIINNGRDIYLDQGCDCLIALGGGSVLDTAKAIGMLATNGGLAEQYQMDGKQVTELTPMLISIPTTAGTGAEATKVSVVKNNYNNLKKSMYHNNMIADIVILDPILTISLNRKRTASTGMDALSHAIESYVSLNANPFSEMYSIKAIELIAENLEICCNDPENLKAREKMLLGSYFGGCSLTAGIGIAHILAQPIGAMMNIPHGDACSIFLPTAMELNLKSSVKKYSHISKALGVFSMDKSDLENAEAGIRKVRKIRNLINAPEHLTPYLPVSLNMEEVLDTIAKTTGHITCNPIKVTNEILSQAIEMSR
jgi:alcohol dehydrogenase class IV